MKFIAQQIKVDLVDHHPLVLAQFRVVRNDRQFQFFKERSLSVLLLRDPVVLQKMRYIHRNPIQPKRNLSAVPEDYVWSSAAFYAYGDKRWSFLTHFWYGEDWPPPLEYR